MERKRGQGWRRRPQRKRAQRVRTGEDARGTAPALDAFAVTSRLRGGQEVGFHLLPPRIKRDRLDKPPWGGAAAGESLGQFKLAVSDRRRRWAKKNPAKPGILVRAVRAQRAKADRPELVTWPAAGCWSSSLLVRYVPGVQPAAWSRPGRWHAQ